MNLEACVIPESKEMLKKDIGLLEKEEINLKRLLVNNEAI
jgi:hypothetical protein